MTLKESRKSAQRPFWAFLPVFGLLAFAMLACRVEAPRIVLEEDTPTPNVIVITQVATQIVTPTPAPVLPTATLPAEAPIATATTPYNPLDAPIYYPLEGCVASRLHVGDRAMVSLVGGPNGIRYGLDIREETIAVYAQPGEILEIIGGPYCSEGWLIWMVRTAAGFVGYTPEGNGNEYWLFPAAPGQ